MRLAEGVGLADIVRALDAEGVDVADLELHAPTLDDVFLAKTGRTLEGAAEEAEADEQEPRRRRERRRSPQVGAIARRSVAAHARASRRASSRRSSSRSLLLAVNAGGLALVDRRCPGFPTDSFLAFALAVPFIQGALFSTMNAGTDLARDIQTGFLNRLSLTPLRGSALLAGQLAGVVVLGAGPGGLLPRRRADRRRPASRPGPAGIVVLLVFAALVALGFGALGAFLALRTGSGEAVQALFPRPLRLPLHLVDEHAART